METHTTPLFTPTEAAVLTRLSVKAVNNAIDKKTILATAGKRAGYTTRLLDLRALMSLTLERRLADRFVPELRRKVFDALAGAPRNTVSLEGGFLKIVCGNRDGSWRPRYASFVVPANWLSAIPKSWEGSLYFGARACRCM